MFDGGVSVRGQDTSPELRKRLVFFLSRRASLPRAVRDALHFAQAYLTFPWGHPLQSEQLRFRFPCTRPWQCGQLRFTLPCGQPLHSGQFCLSSHALHRGHSCFFFSCGQPLHCTQFLIILPWGHGLRCVQFSPQLAMLASLSFPTRASFHVCGIKTLACRSSLRHAPGASSRRHAETSTLSLLSKPMLWLATKLALANSSSNF